MRRRIIEATQLLVEFVLFLTSILWLVVGTIGIVMCAVVISPWFLTAFLLHPVALAVGMWVDERWTLR